MNLASLKHWPTTFTVATTLPATLEMRGQPTISRQPTDQLLSNITEVITGNYWAAVSDLNGAITSRVAQRTPQMSDRRGQIGWTAEG